MVSAARSCAVKGCGLHAPGVRAIDRAMSAAPQPAVRALKEADRAAWAPLWADYLVFYSTELDPAVTDATWRRVTQPDGELHGLGAFGDDGALLGFALYFFHPGTWTVKSRCYLEDLFVADAARGRGAGRALLEAVFAEADAAGAEQVYWQTDEDNARARALYDRVGTLTEYVKYKRDAKA